MICVVSFVALCSFIVRSHIINLQMFSNNIWVELEVLCIPKRNMLKSSLGSTVFGNIK